MWFGVNKKQVANTRIVGKARHAANRKTCGVLDFISLGMANGDSEKANMNTLYSAIKAVKHILVKVLSPTSNRNNIPNIIRRWV